MHTQTEYWMNITNGQTYCDQSVYEDANCSNSLGPAYNPLDHLTYFDVNHSKCIGDAVDLVALPTVLSVSNSIPALPTTIPVTLNGLAGFIVNGIGLPL